MQKRNPRNDAESLKRLVIRSEAAVRRLEGELAQTRFRLAMLEAWLFDKENGGLPMQVYIQSRNEKFYGGQNTWVLDPADALTFDSTLNSVQFCHHNQIKDARLLLQLERRGGPVVMPLDLPL